MCLSIGMGSDGSWSIKNSKSTLNHSNKWFRAIIWLKRYHLTCHRKLIRMKFVVLNDEKKSIRPNGSNLNKCCASNMACYQKCLWAACQESTDSIFFSVRFPSLPVKIQLATIMEQTNWNNLSTIAAATVVVQPNRTWLWNRWFVIIYARTNKIK